MKLLTFKQQGSDYLGALTDAGVFNLSAAAEGDRMSSEKAEDLGRGGLASHLVSLGLVSVTIGLPSSLGNGCRVAT